MKNITRLILIKLFLFTFFVNANPIEEKLNLNPEIPEEKYQPTDRYDEPVELPGKIKKEDSSINLDVDVDKEKKQIDRLKLDVDKKF